MRRVPVRGQENASKRVLMHLGGFDLSLAGKSWATRRRSGYKGHSGRRFADFIAVLGQRLWLEHSRKATRSLCPCLQTPMPVKIFIAVPAA